MSKDTARTYNGSYLYRLNQELSGQDELSPYFITDRTDPDSVEAAVSRQEIANAADGQAETGDDLATDQDEELT